MYESALITRIHALGHFELRLMAKFALDACSLII